MTDFFRSKFRKKSLVGPSSHFDIENTWPVQCRSDEDCASSVIQQIDGWNRFDVKGRVSGGRFFYLELSLFSIFVHPSLQVFNVQRVVIVLARLIALTLTTILSLVVS